MSITFTVLLSVHVVVGVTVIGLVLLQHGKGADMGAAFGSGASGSLFGASGSANFLSRATAMLAAVFFCTSLGLAYLASSTTKASGSVMDTQAVGASTETSVPLSSTNSPTDSRAKDIPQ